MEHTFSHVPPVDVPRSSFNRSHGLKTTFDAGKLIPIFVDEALPGDTFNLRMSGFGRLATPLFPFMDNLFLDTHFFFVPYRLIWNNWERFNGAQDNPDDSTDYLVPTIEAPVAGWSNGTIADYFGLPTEVAGITTSSLPFRAYRLIFNEWFRDQNLQDSLDITLGDGPDSTYYGSTPESRGKRYDYFTSCLPMRS